MRIIYADGMLSSLSTRRASKTTGCTFYVLCLDPSCKNQRHSLDTRLPTFHSVIAHIVTPCSKLLCAPSFCCFITAEVLTLEHLLNTHYCFSSWLQSERVFNWCNTFITCLNFIIMMSTNKVSENVSNSVIFPGTKQLYGCESFSKLCWKKLYLKDDLRGKQFIHCSRLTLPNLLLQMSSSISLSLSLSPLGIFKSFLNFYIYIIKKDY